MSKKVSFKKFTEQDVARYRAEVDNIINKICSGQLYGTNYKDVFEAMKFYYEQQKYEVPFVVICENPMEMGIISNVMKNLYFSKEKGFMKIYTQCVNLARSENPDTEILELASQSLLNYMLPSVVKIVEFYENFKENGNRGDLAKKLKNLAKEDKIVEVILKRNNSVNNVIRDVFSSAVNFLPTAGIFAHYHYLALDVLSEYYNKQLSEFKIFKEFHEKARIMYALTYKDVVIVCKYPKRVYLDGNGRFHNTKGAAIEMGYLHPSLKSDLYYIHGRAVEEKLFKKEFTLNDFISCNDEEKRAAMFEIIAEGSPDEIVNFFDLEEVDHQTITHNVKIPMFNNLGEFVGYKEQQEQETLILYHSKEKYKGAQDPLKPNSDENKLAWIRFVCPSTGTNYMIYTSPSFTSVIDAAKFARPFDMGEYQWTMRS